LPSDVIDLLLPRAPAAVATRARAIVQYLSLLRDHARPTHASTTAVSLERAQQLALSEEREVAVLAIEDLVAHCLRAELGTDTFLCWKEPGLAWDRAWQRLGELFDIVDPTIEIPGARESMASVIRRLAVGLQRLDAGAARCLYLEACALRLESGTAQAEARLLAALQARSAPGAAAMDLAWLVRGIAALRLDRGAVRQSRALIEDHLAFAAADPVLARLAAWCAFLLEDEPAGKELSRGAGAEVPMPRALLEWEAAGGPSLDPAPTSPLAAESRAGAPGANAIAAPIARAEFGACVLLLVRLEAGEPVLHAADCSPGLRPALDAWWRDRETCHRTVGEPEQRLIAGRSGVLEHATSGVALRGCLGGNSVRACALEPVLRDGDLIGWIRLEFEHHLVPSRHRLERLAQFAAMELEPRGPGIGQPAAEGAATRAPRRLRHTRRRTETEPRGKPEGLSEGRGPQPARAPNPTQAQRDAAPFDLGGSIEPHDPRAQCLSQAIALLEMKLAQRRWWGFDLPRGQARLLCEHGGELADWRERGGRGQALARALQCQGIVWFDDCDPSQSLHAASASGIALAICWQHQPIGALAIESQRRHDFRGLEPGALQTWRASTATQLREACFRVWHTRRFGHDVHVDFSAPGLRQTLAELFAAAKAGRPTALHGPPGSGKRVLARLLHHEAARGAPLLRMHGVVASAEQAASRLFGSRTRDGLWRRARGGTLLIERVESLPPAVQRRLHDELGKAELDGFESAPRLVTTSALSVGENVAAGALLPCLSDHFDGLEIAVPALAQRRDEIPALVRRILDGLAVEERLIPPVLDESCLALLWRQDWPGNLRELEQFLYRIALLYPGRVVDAEELGRAAARHRLDLSKRIVPRQAERELVLMALTCTRKQNGSFNKSRAAAYLGWETETLVARLREFEAQGQPIGGLTD